MDRQFRVVFVPSHILVSGPVLLPNRDPHYLLIACLVLNLSHLVFDLSSSGL
jgi:hypothetical protein